MPESAKLSPPLLPTIDWVRGVTSRGPVDPDRLVGRDWPKEKADRWKASYTAHVDFIDANKAQEEAKQAKVLEEAQARASEIKQGPPIIRELASGARMAAFLGIGGLSRLVEPLTHDPRFGDPLSDIANRAVAEEAQAVSISQDDSIFLGALTSAAQSLVTAAALAATGGGQPAIIAGFAGSEASQTWTKATDAGLTGRARRKVVGRAALIEGGITAIASILGVGGTEKILSGTLSRVTAGRVLSHFLAEVTEENIIELMSAYNEETAGLSGPLTRDKAIDILKRTTLATLFGFGTAKGLHSYKGLNERRLATKDLAAARGWTDAQAKFVVDMAHKRNGDFVENVGRVIGEERRLTRVELANWALNNKAAAKALVDKADEMGEVSRRTWEGAGFPSRNKPVRERVVGVLREHLAFLDSLPAAEVVAPLEGVDLEAWARENAGAVVDELLGSEGTPEDFIAAGLPVPPNAEAALEQIEGMVSAAEEVGPLEGVEAAPGPFAQAAPEPPGGALVTPQPGPLEVQEAVVAEPVAPEPTAEEALRARVAERTGPPPSGPVDKRAEKRAKREKDKAAKRALAEAAVARKKGLKITPEVSAFAETVRAAAESVPAESRFGDKVFIADAWDAFSKDNPGATREEFNASLITANRVGLISLSRADLVEAMDAEKVADSEVKDRQATFNFIRLPKAEAPPEAKPAKEPVEIPSAIPVPSAEEARPAEKGREIPGFKDDTKALPSEGAMSVVYQGENKPAQAAAMNVGELSRILRKGGAATAKVFRKLAAGAVGRFRGTKGIDIRADAAIGPLIRTGLADASEAVEIKAALTEQVLEDHPGLSEGDLEIRTNAERGQVRITIYRRDPDFAAKVLAHEIGHWIDFMPDETMARGNILGRLASLRGFMKSTLDSIRGVATKGADKRTLGRLRRQARKVVGDPPPRGTVAHRAWKERSDAEFARLANAEGYLTGEQVTQELKALTRWWNPFDEQANPAYTRYRFSAKELYAEALSVLLTDPAAAEKRAPLTYHAWFQLGIHKPEVKKAYDSVVQEVLSGTSEIELLKDMYSAQEEGEDAYRRLAESLKTRLDPIGFVGTAFVDRHFRLYGLIRREKKAGRKFVDPKYTIDDAKYTGAVLEEMFRQIGSVAKKLEKAGLSQEDMGVYLQFMDGLLGEGEGGLRFRPTVGDLAGLKKTFAAFETRMGDAKMAALEVARKAYRKTRKELVIDRLAASGVYDSEFMDLLERNEFYARSDVVKYIERQHGEGAGTGLRMIARVGTIQGVSNAWTSTIAADATLIWATNWNHAKRRTGEFLLGAGEATEAKTVWDANKKRRSLVEPTDQKLGLIAYMKDGKVEGVYVDKVLAEGFDRPGSLARNLASILRIFASPMRQWLTNVRPGFQLFNIFFRDPLRTIKNLPGLGLRPDKIYVNLAKSLYAVGIEGFTGNPDAVLQEMRKRGLLISWGLQAEVDDDTNRLEAYLGQQGKSKTKRQALKRGIQAWYAKWMAFGAGGETANKRAAFVFLTENQQALGWSDDQINHAVRHWAGSPSFITGGGFTAISNNLLLFSNAQIQGWRSDIEAFNEDRMGVGAKRIAYGLMPKIAMAVVGSGLLVEFFKFMGSDDDDPEVEWAKARQRELAGVSEYDLINYTIFPAGLTKSGKTIYFRLPQDETDRAISGAMMKLLLSPNAEGLQDVASYTGEQFPGWNPAYSLAAEVLDYWAGGNPYDDFRGRKAVPEHIFRAGGMRSHKAFGKWLSNRYGGTFIHRFKTDNPAEIQEWYEKALGVPILGTDVAGRFFKVSGFGVYQKAMREQEKARAKRDSERLDLDEAVKAEIGGRELTEDQKRILREEPVSAKRKRDLLVKRGGGPLARALLGARSSEETKATLQMFFRMDGDSPALRSAIAEFAGPRLYDMSRAPPSGKGRTRAEYQAAIAQWRTDTKRAEELLEGLPVESWRKVFWEHWSVKRDGKDGPAYRRRLGVITRKLGRSR